jgi:hypothetical protein
MITDKVVRLDSVCDTSDTDRRIRAETAVRRENIFNYRAVIPNAYATTRVICNRALANGRAVVWPDSLLRVVTGFAIDNQTASGSADSNTGISVRRTSSDLSSRSGNDSVSAGAIIPIRRTIRDRAGK